MSKWTIALVVAAVIGLVVWVLYRIRAKAAVVVTEDPTTGNVVVEPVPPHWDLTLLFDRDKHPLQNPVGGGTLQNPINKR